MYLGHAYTLLFFSFLVLELCTTAANDDGIIFSR